MAYCEIFIFHSHHLRRALTQSSVVAGFSSTVPSYRAQLSHPQRDAIVTQIKAEPINHLPWAFLEETHGQKRSKALS